MWAMGWSFWLEAGQGSGRAVRCPCVKRRGQVRKKQDYVSVRETQTGPEVSWGGAGGSSVPRLEQGSPLLSCGNTPGCLLDIHSSEVVLDNNAVLHRVAVFLAPGDMPSQWVTQGGSCASSGQ